MEFKVGDIVRLTVDNLAARPGAKAVVREGNTEKDGFTYIKIDWDEDDPRVKNQANGCYYPESFELAVERELTDEELACHAKVARAEFIKYYDLLRERGYTLYIYGNAAISPTKGEDTYRKSVLVSI